MLHELVARSRFRTRTLLVVGLTTFAGTQLFLWSLISRWTTWPKATPWIALGAVAVVSLFAARVGKALVLRSIGAVPLPEAEHRHLTSAVEEMAAAGGLAGYELYFVSSGSINAASVASLGTAPAIVFTTAVLRLDPEATRGLAARQVADIVMGRAYGATFAASIIYLCDAVRLLLDVAERRIHMDIFIRLPLMVGTFALIAFGTGSVVPASIYALGWWFLGLVWQSALSGTSHLEVDVGAVLLTRQPEWPAAALAELERGSGKLGISVATRHLWAVDPTVALDTGSWFSQPTFPERRELLDATSTWPLDQGDAGLRLHLDPLLLTAGGFRTVMLSLAAGAGLLSMAIAVGLFWTFNVPVIPPLEVIVALPHGHQATQRLVLYELRSSDGEYLDSRVYPAGSSPIRIPGEVVGTPDAVGGRVILCYLDESTVGVQSFSLAPGQSNRGSTRRLEISAGFRRTATDPLHHVMGPAGAHYHTEGAPPSHLTKECFGAVATGVERSLESYQTSLRWVKRSGSLGDEFNVDRHREDLIADMGLLSAYARQMRETTGLGEYSEWIVYADDWRGILERQVVEAPDSIDTDEDAGGFDWLPD